MGSVNLLTTIFHQRQTFPADVRWACWTYGPVMDKQGMQERGGGILLWKHLNWILPACEDTEGYTEKLSKYGRKSPGGQQSVNSNILYCQYLSWLIKHQYRVEFYQTFI